MKILLLSSFPHDLYSYDRHLSSKIHKELGKELEILHFIYLFKDKNNKNNSTSNYIVLPFFWDRFYKKIANIFFMIFQNIKIIKNNDVDIIRLELGNSIYDYPIFVYPLIFPQKKFYVETTTPAVQKSKLKRMITNFMLRLALKPYRYIGMASIETKDVLKIPKMKVIHSQIGFPEYVFTIKNFQNLSLVYLGTLNNRDLEKTVIGFRLFLLKHPNVKMTYDIIGGGNKKYVAELEKSLIENSMENIIRYHGFQPTEFVNEIFKKCNVGIAFVPIVEYYDKVSTTKAVEYLLTGMPIIATKTSFSNGILKDEAGVLCDDSPEDFARALEEIYFNRTKFNSEKIREIYKNYGMSWVIKNKYIPMLKSLVPGEN